VLGHRQTPQLFEDGDGQFVFLRSAQRR
jgi:hypothetical protein